MVNRLHAKLFEDAARELDRQIRAQYLSDGRRPEYLKEFEKRLEAVTRQVEEGVETGGRMLWMKKALKRMMRPYLHHQEKVNRLLVERVAALHENVCRLRTGLDELGDEMRADLARYDESIRAEFARKRGPGQTFAAPSQPVAQNVDPIRPGSKVLLGDVLVGLSGYLHVNSANGSNADLIAPYDALPLEPAAAAELVVANVLERYPVNAVRHQLLPYWASLLRPGGRLTLVADDFGAAADRFREGRIDFEELAGLLFGEGEVVRRSVYTPEQLRGYLSEAGLVDVSVTERRQRPDAGAYGFAIVGYSPAV